MQSIALASYRPGTPQTTAKLALATRWPVPCHAPVKASPMSQKSKIDDGKRPHGRPVFLAHSIAERETPMSTTKPSPPKLAYSVREAVEATSLSKTYLYNAISTGRLKVNRVGSRSLIPADVLKAFIAGEGA